MNWKVYQKQLITFLRFCSTSSFEIVILHQPVMAFIVFLHWQQG